MCSCNLVDPFWPRALYPNGWFEQGVPTMTVDDRDHMDTGEQVGHIGSLGRNAGQLYWIGGIATDSRGNIYTGEVSTGKRVQKLVLQ